MAGQKLIPLAEPDEAAASLRSNVSKAKAETPVLKPTQWTPGDATVLCFQWSEADAVQAIRVLEWWLWLRNRLPGLDEAEKSRPHIVSFRPKRTPVWAKNRVDELLRQVGAGLDIVEPAFDLPDERYPRGSVWGFWHLAEFCHSMRYDFVLMEPDAIPLHGLWWNQMEAEMVNRPTPFLGHIEPPHPSGGYPAHMAGCGGYSWEVWRSINTSRIDLAFDVALGEHIVPRCTPSVCIQQVFGGDAPPRFRTQDDLRIIRGNAVLFHRNKDGSLLDLLRERLTSHVG